ncbi:MAG TPA: nucleotidyl transferase AbiEii/AbiGii toxin family protein [Kamptonema sp.]|nr:nucleotidyl transferase AbiEii/AbiGii toxin family protein [Kamptonema sp.]
MNQEFKRFLELSQQDRQDVFEAEAENLDTRPSYVEKDFWVCLVLDILYNGLNEDHPRLLFKGGTSLSKGYNLIDRFSEDVDFTVFREDIGFDESKDPAAPGISGNERKRRSDRIIQATSEYICHRLREDLETIALTVVSECSVIEDQDKSTLLFHYPSLFAEGSDAYIQPRVKLEGGGRSALDPHEKLVIQPLINDTLTDWDFSVPNIITIKPERTFWDKVMILHGWSCRHRDKEDLPEDPQRISRHYYDVAMIYQKLDREAISDPELRENVRQHTQEFFKRAWMKLDEAIPGSFHLVPKGKLLQHLKKDYQAMQGMILGNAPNFETIVEQLEELETAINKQT